MHSRPCLDYFIVLGTNDTKQTKQYIISSLSKISDWYNCCFISHRLHPLQNYCIRLCIHLLLLLLFSKLAECVFVSMDEVVDSSVLYGFEYLGWDHAEVCVQQLLSCIECQALHLMKQPQWWDHFLHSEWFFWRNEFRVLLRTSNDVTHSLSHAGLTAVPKTKMISWQSTFRQRGSSDRFPWLVG